MRPTESTIDVTKINKAWLFKGKKGTYLKLVSRENKGGKGKYGDDGFVVQKATKEAREAGEKNIIVGNWRFLGEDEQPQPKPSAPKSKILPTEADQPAEDDVPF